MKIKDIKEVLTYITVAENTRKLMGITADSFYNEGYIQALNDVKDWINSCAD
jgi:hypothetical protein